MSVSIACRLGGWASRLLLLIFLGMSGAGPVTAGGVDSCADARDPSDLPSRSRLIVKFADDARVRLRDGAWVSLAGADVVGLREAMGGYAEARAEPLLPRRSDGSDSRIERRSSSRRDRAADLGAFHRVTLRDPGRRDALVDDLSALPIVDVVYPESWPEPAGDGAGSGIEACPVRGPSADYSACQRYVEDAASGGLGAVEGWSRGARGQGTRFVDMEYAWWLADNGAAPPTLEHPDLPPALWLHTGGYRASFSAKSGYRNHGTSGLGEIVAKHQPEAIGIRGIAPRAEVGISSWADQGSDVRSNFCSATEQALSAMRYGDVLAMILHIKPTEAQTRPCKLCESGCLCAWLAVEADACVHALIREAVFERGIVVIEAAGNGSVGIDDIDPIRIDSGAIMVGASLSDGVTPASFSNFGRRVDVHGWGVEVMTTSGRKGYRFFRGTSAATAMITGLALAVQSYHIEHLGVPLDGLQMRALLSRYAIPMRRHPDAATQPAWLGRNIGPRPYIPAILDAIDEGDRDHDGLLDIFENGGGVYRSSVATGTTVTPGRPDGDGDGVHDGAEVAELTNPNDPADHSTKATGDLSGDGRVDGDDVLLGKRVVSAGSSAGLTPAQISRGDLDGVPGIALADVKRIERIVAGAR